MKMYHFAYGSNMNMNELKKFLNNKIKIIGVGYLDNYIFKYRKIKNRKLSAKGNIEKRNGSRVYGIIFELKGSLENLHKKEGIFNYTYKIDFFDIKLLKNNKKVLCFSYIMTQTAIDKIGKPSKNYKNKIVSIANKFNFPLQYIKTKLDIL
jgi:hypothetical protein